MTIIEAINSLKEDQAINRKAYPNTWRFVPTDTSDCVRWYDESGLVASRWNPNKEDLVTDDWYVAQSTGDSVTADDILLPS